ncbi:hypothetical protein FQN51_000300 [Onygenales sp. PD_10]|nr:hypothetical protein FQN51_000300 [Onygenales sp. PD_10]
MSAIGGATSPSEAGASAEPRLDIPNEPPGLLQTFQGHIEDIRTLIYCGVCVKPLYEPFTLACGHTFCYSCLTQWFASHRRKKTCPDCRAAVSVQPAPAYLVRQIVQMFIGRAELLDHSETTAEHSTNMRIETEKMEADKQNTNPTTGGLFQGCFKNATRSYDPIHDTMDGVTRCPRCAWELEEGGCAQCGFAIAGYSDSEEESDEDASINMTDADDIEDGFGVDDDEVEWGAVQYEFPEYFHGIPANPLLHHEHAHNWFGRPFSEDPEESEDDESDNSEMADFIDDNSAIDDSDSDNSTIVSGSLHPHEPISLISDDVEAEAIHQHDDNSDDDGDENENDDDDDDAPIRAPTRAAQRRRPAVGTFTSDEDSDSEPLNTTGEGNTPVAARTRASRSISSRPNTGQATGSTVNSPIDLDDDSDAPIGPARMRQRRPRRQRRNHRRPNATVSSS